MSKPLRVMLEVGPKQKKTVAVAPDWPGLERGGKSGEIASETLCAYIPRYEKVAQLAAMSSDYADIDGMDVVETYPGTGSTDFWGISFAFSSIDHEPMSSQELSRQIALMTSCWGYFDDVRGRVSPEMAKGPRGGGRDRDTIVRHVMATEQDWSGKLGVRGSKDPVVTDDESVKSWRDEYCQAIREFWADGKLARNWPLRFLIRHTAYHTMDHAWEMEDKDLSGQQEHAG